jgi:hypothetical protein
LARRYGADAAILERFSQTEICRDLATARRRLWGVEFALTLNVDRPTDAPAVQGVVDCAWEDPQGGWHLLYFCHEDMTPAARERYWTCRQREIVLAATAMELQTGTWPRDVQVYFLATGDVFHKVGNRLPAKRVQAEIIAALTPP